MISRAIAAILLCWTVSAHAVELGDVRGIMDEARLSPAPSTPAAAAPAPEAAPAVPQFCADPSGFVCGSDSGEGERKREIVAEQDSLRKKALEATLEYVGIPQSRWSEFTEADVPAKLPLADRLKAHRFYFKELRDLFQDYLIKNDLPADLGLSQLKANMKEAIAASSDFSPAMQQKMTAIVEETRLIELSDYASGPELPSTDLATFWRGCGKDKLIDNAFSTHASGDRRIVICPGYLIGSIQYAKSNGMPHDLLLAGMTDTLAHEIGHQFDAITPGFKDAYGSTLLLLEQNQLGLNPGTPAKKYMSESTADLWGARTLAVALPAIADPAVRATVLKENFADLCDAADDKIHPSGRFRIDVIDPAVLCR
jgi:hypothetical protein